MSTTSLPEKYREDESSSEIWKVLQLKSWPQRKLSVLINLPIWTRLSSLELSAGPWGKWDIAFHSEREESVWMFWWSLESWCQSSKSTLTQKVTPLPLQWLQRALPSPKSLPLLVPLQKLPRLLNLLQCFTVVPSMCWHLPPTYLPL